MFQATQFEAQSKQQSLTHLEAQGAAVNRALKTHSWNLVRSWMTPASVFPGAPSGWNLNPARSTPFPQMKAPYHTHRTWPMM